MKNPSEAITQKIEWHPSYWEKNTHGSSWEKVKAALQRDWEQTRADFHAGGKDLKQQVTDTLKQATGKEPIPAEGVQNPDPDNKPVAWADAEPGIRYGHTARAQYGTAKWNDALEVKLSSEWDETANGKPFAAVRPYVRHGWDTKKS